MLVVVHDVSSVFLAELGCIVEQLERVVGRQMSAAIVPRWRGHCLGTANAAYRDLLRRFSEHLLHGWTHQGSNRMRPLSLLTGAADEFWGLEEATILERLELAQADFRELTGKKAAGFLPPAWQLPIRAARLSSFEFVMRFRRLESCRDRGRIHLLATSSWDWGRLGWLGYGGEWLGHLLRRTNRGAIPCIAIHPIDVRRGYLARALRLIAALVRNGYRAVTAAEVMRVQEGPS
jgi:predicted deacetylase